VPGRNAFAKVAVIVVVVEVAVVARTPPSLTVKTPSPGIPFRFVPVNVSTVPAAFIDASVITGGPDVAWAETARPHNIDTADSA
jgi:hypothetical protein